MQLVASVQELKFHQSHQWHKDEWKLYSKFVEVFEVVVESKEIECIHYISIIFSEKLHVMFGLLVFG